MAEPMQPEALSRIGRYPVRRYIAGGGMSWIFEVVDPELGRVTMMAPAVRLSRTPGAIRFPGRHLGADTRGVLEELGYDADLIDRLIADGVAVARAAPL